MGWIAALVVLLGLMGGGAWAGYEWTQTRFYVGADEDSVVIYRGVPAELGPFSLSSVHEDTDIPLADLPNWQRENVEATISARSLTDARNIVENLRPADGTG